MASVSSIALSAGENAKTIRSARRLDRRRMLFWVVPPVAWFTVFMLIPYAMLLYTSLGRVEDMRFIPGLSLHNFIQVFTVDPYLSVIIKSARIGLMTAVLSAIVAYPLSFFLAFHVRSSRLKFLIYLLVIVPWWASYLVKAYAWKTILGSGGILNALLQKAGLTDEPVRIFLYNEFSVVVTLTYIFTPFAVLSIYAQLERIRHNLTEIALTQSYQDLTGQIIRRVVGIVRRVHEGFGALGLPPEQHRTDPELAGPALKGLDRHAVSQNDADDLLSDLGL